MSLEEIFQKKSESLNQFNINTKKFVVEIKTLLEEESDDDSDDNSDDDSDDNSDDDSDKKESDNDSNDEELIKNEIKISNKKIMKIYKNFTNWYGFPYKHHFLLGLLLLLKIQNFYNYIKTINNNNHSLEKIKLIIFNSDPNKKNKINSFLEQRNRFKSIVLIQNIIDIEFYSIKRFDNNYKISSDMFSKNFINQFNTEKFNTNIKLEILNINHPISYLNIVCKFKFKEDVFIQNKDDIQKLNLINGEEQYNNFKKELYMENRIDYISFDIIDGDLQKSFNNYINDDNKFKNDILNDLCDKTHYKYENLLKYIDFNNVEIIFNNYILIYFYNLTDITKNYEEINYNSISYKLIGGIISDGEGELIIDIGNIKNKNTIFYSRKNLILLYEKKKLNLEKIDYLIDNEIICDNPDVIKIKQYLQYKKIYNNLNDIFSIIAIDPLSSIKYYY